MENIEREIRFRLAKDGGPLVKGDSYHAIIEKRVDQPIDAVPEIAAATGLRPAEIRFYVESAFEHMAQNVLSDGQPRRFGDLFDVSAAITGRFDRIDGEFDPTRHRFVLNLSARKGLKELKRQTPPVNVRPKPRGRIDYVTWPGGEKGELKFGEDIVIVGHDLTLTYGDTVQLHLPNGTTLGHDFVFNADGSQATWDDGTIIENRGFVDANTRAIANMDRRQKKFFTFLAPVQQKLATIFHRKEKDPYAAVTVSEPRRSQLIEVIDYTMTHPIEYDSKTRDVFTLSNAARAVWNLNHRKWEPVKGGYETFEALKGACYGLQKKQNDPFHYQ